MDDKRTAGAARVLCADGTILRLSSIPGDEHVYMSADVYAVLEAPVKMSRSDIDALIRALDEVKP